ncbi:MAG: hypothetical protein RLW62_04445 [Gammaproteobacteria bacterium]
MPIVDPLRYRDKTVAWWEFFLRRRAAELAPLVTAEVLAEHLADPRGERQPHSHALRQGLDFIHNQPTDGKSFAYAATPYAEYRLGVMHARGDAPTIVADPTYASEREAVHAVFLERLHRLGLLPAAGDDAGQRA